MKELAIRGRRRLESPTPSSGRIISQSMHACIDAELPARRRSVLERVAAVVGSDALRDALLLRYGDVLRQRFGGEQPTPPGAPDDAPGEPTEDEPEA